MKGTIKYLAKGSQPFIEEIPDGFDKNTCFRLASVSKQFTAISLLILVDDGVLSLDDLVRTYFPELNWSESTIRHLLEHTSDIEDCYHHVDEDVEYLNEDLIPLIQSNGFVPGKEYIYCNTGYDLIPIIVERTLKQSYPSFLQERIFTPLGMTRTFLASTDLSGEDNIADCYYSETGERYGYHHLNKIWGSGGIFSCVNDLQKWNLGMSELVSEELLKLAKSEITPNYGFGFEVYEDRTAHSGCWEGFNVYLAFYPEDATSVIVLSNLDDVDADKIGRKLKQSFPKLENS